MTRAARAAKAASRGGIELTDTVIEKPKHKWRFMQLTLFMGAWMLVSPLMNDRWLVQVMLQLFLLNSALVTLWANPSWRRVRRVVFGLWVVSICGAALALLAVPEGWHRVARGVEILSTMPLMALLAVGILRFVFRQGELSSDSLFATIAVYLLIALMFAQVYLLLLATNPASFNLPAAAAERSPHLLHIDMLYFSLITLATVGYGDILPLTEPARMLAVIEATVGQFYVAVLVAVFVGMYSAQQRK